MQDSSRSLFSTLKPKSSQALRLAVLTAMGGAASLGAQAQSVSGDNPAAVKAAVGIAVQDGIQILNSAQSQTSKKPQASQSSRKAQSTIASAAGNEPKRIGAYDENTLLAQSSTPATGDASTDQTSEAPELQEVVVTGSMIARPTAETAEAVTTISVDTLKAQGITTAEEALQRISANMTGNAYVTASAVTTFDGGAAYANLRGIGSNKTLVLLDGQRVATNVVTGDGIDLSTIPFAAIDNIEVLREGASSLYGTDAIGGVINFITKKNYQKGELDIDATKPEDGGGGGTDASVTLGHGSLADDGYNFLFAGDFNYGAELRAAQRPFADIGFVPGANLAGATTNNPYTTPGSFIDNAGNQYQVNYPSCPTNDHLTTYYPGECTYIYTTATDLIPRNIKESGLAELTKTLPGNNQLEIQYFYARSDLDTWAGPESYSALVTPASPYYPTVAESVCATAINPGCAGVPPVLGGDLQALWTDAGNSRNNEFVNTEQRLLLTFSGDNAGWDYATDFNFSLNHDNQYVAGYPDLSYFENDAGELDPSINPFGAQSAAGAALLRQSYSKDGKVAVGTYREWIVDAHASHKLGDAFNAGREAAVAIGAQVEGEHVGYTTTPLATYTALTTGFSPTYTLGGRTSQAVFAEMDVPMGKQLDLTVSDREDRYSDFGTTNNGKVQLRYQPAQFLTFRGTASTGFRAPTLFELFRPPTFGATGDMSAYPGCATGAYTAVFTASNCQTQGLALFGGNTTLKPETSENFDLGIILEPIENLGVTLDWYRIIVANAISTVPSTAIYESPATFPSYYVLNNSGSLTGFGNEATDCNPYTAATCGYILQNDANSGGLETNGFDLSADYTQHTFLGNFKYSLDGTLVTKFETQLYTNAPELNRVGEWIEGEQPIIRWSHQFNVDWTYGAWGAGINNHFLSAYKDFALEFGPACPVGGAPCVVHTVANYSIWGLYGSWKPIDPLMVTLGIDNVLDTDPPFSNQAGGTNTNWQSGYNPIYSDPTGRAFYLRLKYQFL